MPSAEGLILVTGGVSFAGNFKEQGGFPDNGYGIIAATVALTFLAAVTAKGKFERPVVALAGLMLLGALYRYIPTFTSNVKTKTKRTD